MTPSVTEVPQELRELPQVALDAIHAACSGDWRRVEALGPHEWMVHNQPQMRRIELPDVRPRRHRRRWQGAVTSRALPMESHPSSLPHDMSPMTAARIMAQELREGLDEGSIDLSPHIARLPQHLLDLAFSACRLPSSVEASPESQTVGPRLLFKQGDVTVVVAINDLTKPVIVALLTSR